MAAHRLARSARAMLAWHKLAHRLRVRLYGPAQGLRMFEGLAKPLIVPMMRHLGANIGHNVDIEGPVYFHNAVDLRNLAIGAGSHLGKGCFFDLRSPITIGQGCVISMGTLLLTHQDCNASPLRAYYPASKAPLSIEDGCYLGARAIILMGANLATCTVVAAGSTVTKPNLVPFAVMGGTPAKPMKVLPHIPGLLVDHLRAVDGIELPHASEDAQRPHELAASLASDDLKPTKPTKPPGPGR